MCRRMVDIQSPTAEIRRAKKERRKKKKQDENIMVCPITQGDHNYLIRTFTMISENIHLLLEWSTSGTVYQIMLLTLIMVSLWNRADYYIFILSFVLLLLLLLLLPSLFPRLISAAADWMTAIYFHTWCGLSANLECTSETCCALLAENTGRKILAKIAIWAPSHNFVGLYLRN